MGLNQTPLRGAVLRYGRNPIKYECVSWHNSYFISHVKCAWAYNEDRPFACHSLHTVLFLDYFIFIFFFYFCNVIIDFGLK